MRVLSTVMLFLLSSSAALAERVEMSLQQAQTNRQTCFKIMQELKEIKFLRDQKMDTWGPKNLFRDRAGMAGEISGEWLFYLAVTGSLH